MRSDHRPFNFSARDDFPFSKTKRHLPSMKNNLTVSPVQPQPNDEDIRDYADHLCQQGSRVPGHDLDNWLEATACLKANIPAQGSRNRLHRHLNGIASGDTDAGLIQAKNFPS
jgi:hypothetical protein